MGGILNGDGSDDCGHGSRMQMFPERIFLVFCAKLPIPTVNIKSSRDYSPWVVTTICWGCHLTFRPPVRHGQSVRLEEVNGNEKGDIVRAPGGIKPAARMGTSSVPGVHTIFMFQTSQRLSNVGYLLMVFFYFF